MKQAMKKEENHHEKSLLGQFSELALGESLTVPVGRLSYVRNICTTFGMQWGKKFTTKVNRNEGVITATRTV